MHKKVTVVKEIMWNEQMDGNELFDAVLEDEHGEMRIMRCCECFDNSVFTVDEWEECVSLKEYVVEFIDNWA